MFSHCRDHILPMLIGLLILSTSGWAGTASAQDSSQVALSLGNVLASEELCGLHYDQDVIKKYIDSHVRADDMDFIPTLRLMTEGSRYQNQQMSPSTKTAHCEQTTRVARSYGFIQ
jgi:hypothetical protein